jgi:hypothetical protein
MLHRRPEREFRTTPRTRQAVIISTRERSGWPREWLEIHEDKPISFDETVKLGKQGRPKKEGAKNPLTAGLFMVVAVALTA